MKNIIYCFIFWCIHSLFFTVKTFAQHSDPSPEQLSEFKELTLRRVNDLTNYIKQIGDKSLPERPRLKSIQLAMSLFDTVYYNANGKKLPECQQYKYQEKMAVLKIFLSASILTIFLNYHIFQK